MSPIFFTSSQIFGSLGLQGQVVGQVVFGLLDDRAVGRGIAKWSEVARSADCCRTQRRSQRQRRGAQVRRVLLHYATHSAMSFPTTHISAIAASADK